MALLAPISAGELIDKITILRIKRERIGDDEKRRNVERELELLESIARSVYLENDRRAAVKRRINELLGSEIVEEKSYKPY